jgi:hypothetical protein
MKKQISELSGAALDWVVLVLCEGYENDKDVMIMDKGSTYVYSRFSGNLWSPSHEWRVGGPIIEREKIRLINKTENDVTSWAARTPGSLKWNQGETPLIAAMRCYVASKLGDDVDIPDELC